ncbi:MAG: hypothetical protein C0412_11605 [Flavobacterium sp.]|nr:hypothetical protein [Flavobacterium sp.]
MDNATYKTRKLYQLDIALLKPDQNQPRKYFDETAINELTESIKQLGVLQPVIFRVDENNNPILVAGERRFMASQKAGLSKIPAIYIDGKADEIAIVENLLRMDLTALEEAEALKSMKDCDTRSQSNSAGNQSRWFSHRTIPNRNCVLSN